MRSNLTRSALAVALATTVLGMAGCGGGKQAAGGTGGLPPAPSTALAGNEKPVAATAPGQTGAATAATTATATAQATPGANPAPKTAVNAEAKPEPEPGAPPAAGGPTPVKPQAAAATPAPSSTTAPTPAATPAPAPTATPPRAPTPAPVPKSGDATPLKFAELYSGASIERGLQISEKTQALNGRRVRMTGYMAPPLKPSLDFFVLTKQPMSICPFCSTDADWPDDIILVLVKQKQEAATATTAIQVTGVLEVGGKQDPETGFYSVMRIYADKVEEVK